MLPVTSAIQSDLLHLYLREVNVYITLYAINPRLSKLLSYG